MERSKKQWIGIYWNAQVQEKNNVDIKNEEVKGKISEVEEIKILKCRRKSHVETVNEEMKGISSEQEENGIRDFRRRSSQVIINEKMEGCASSSKQQEAPPEPTNNKEDICLEQVKIKVKRIPIMG